MKRHLAETDLLGAGAHFIAFALPESSCVVKFPRPDGPHVRGWKGWLLPGPKRAHRTRRAAAAHAVFCDLLASPRFDTSLVFPQTLIERTADLRFAWRGRAHHYRGPAYIQARVEMFNDETPLDTFEWNGVAEVQLRLWSVGVGLDNTADTWGPPNWGRVASGHVRLVDLSALTRDRESVSRRIAVPAREKRRRALLRGQPPDRRDLIEKYLDTIALSLNEDSLRRVWQSAASEQ